jgi:glutathione S-transferase
VNRLLVLGSWLLVLGSAFAADEPFRPEAGKFPPLEKALSYRGELVFVDHATRRGSIRVQGAGTYFRNAPHPFALLPYGIVRYTNEARRLYSVMEQRIAQSRYIGGAEYSIADIAIFPWLRSSKNQGIDWADYPNLKGWFDEVAARPAVMRGDEVLAALRRPLVDDRAREVLLGATQFKKH